MEWRNLHPGYVHFSPFWSVAEAVVLLSEVRALLALEPWLAARLPGCFTADFSLEISSFSGPILGQDRPEKNSAKC